MNKYLVALLMAGSLLVNGCNEQARKKERAPIQKSPSQIQREIVNQINATGTITDAQAALLVIKSELIRLEGLTKIADSQANLLCNATELYLPNLPSITDEQANSLGSEKSKPEWSHFDN